MKRRTRAICASKQIDRQALFTGEKEWLCLSLPDAPVPYEIAMEDDFLTLHTSLAPDALKEKLRLWEPWSHRGGLR
jgi:hypothetical protein